MITPMNLEQKISEAVPGRGYADQVTFQLRALGSTSSNTLLTSSSTPKLVSDAGGLRCVQWEFDGAAADTAEIDYTFPDWFVDTDPSNAAGVGGIELILVARKYDTSSDENATLKLQSNIVWNNPGEAQKTLTTPATATLATAVLTANSLGYAEYRLGLGARAKAENKRIKKGASALITFGPNGIVGATDMKLQIVGVRLSFMRHVGIGGDRAKRIISG